MNPDSKHVEDVEPIVPDGWSGEPLFVIFYIPAPWPLSIPTGSTFAFSNNERVPWLKGAVQQPTEEFQPHVRGPEDDSGFASILVGRVKRSTTADTWQVEAAFDFCAAMFGRKASLSGGRALEVTRDVTVFEVVTPLVPKCEAGNVDIHRSVSNGFDRCLEAVNELLRAYSVAAKDFHVEDLTRHRVVSTIPWATREPQSTVFRGPGIFMVNERYSEDSRDPGVMQDEEVQKMMTMVSRDRQAQNGSDPSMAASLLSRKAAHATFAQSDFSEGVIWSYAWIESLLNGVLMSTAWEAGVPIEEARKWFKRGLVQRTKRHLKRQIGERVGCGKQRHPVRSMVSVRSRA